MKKFAGLFVVLLLAGAMQALAAGLITKQQAEQDALNAVGGGTVISAVRDRIGDRKPIWSVDIRGAAHEFEVWVDAHNGAILKIITQPLSPDRQMISQSQAESAAQSAIGGGQLLQTELGSEAERREWVVDLKTSEAESEVRVDANSGAIVKITTRMDAANNCTFISKAQAKAIALNAVNGKTVLSIRLEKNDHPIIWSVDVRTASGKEYEVHVDACTGKVLAIIPG